MTTQAQKTSRGAVQDTGNPVFDSVVNILMNSHMNWQIDHFDQLHIALLKLYEKEPVRGSNRRQSAGEITEAHKAAK